MSLKNPTFRTDSCLRLLSYKEDADCEENFRPGKRLARVIDTLNLCDVDPLIEQ